MQITSMLRRSFLGLGLALVAGAAFGEVKVGTDFDLINPARPVDTAGKVEVIEFFWFGCPHCNHLEPAVEKWEKTLGKDVVFRREHIMWEGRNDMANHVKLFVALKSMGIIDKHTQAVFDAIHKDRIELRDEPKLMEWVAKQGIDRAKFEAAYKSFGAQAQFARALQLTRDYKVNGVPTFVVNGKYTTSVGKFGSEERLFEVLNELIAKERDGLKPAAKAADKPKKQ